MKMRSVWSSETLVTIYQLTRCNLPEELGLKQRRLWERHISQVGRMMIERRAESSDRMLNSAVKLSGVLVWLLTMKLCCTRRTCIEVDRRRISLENHFETANWEDKESILYRESMKQAVRIKKNERGKCKTSTIFSCIFFLHYIY